MIVGALKNIQRAPNGYTRGELVSARLGRIEDAVSPRLNETYLYDVSGSIFSWYKLKTPWDGVTLSDLPVEAAYPNGPNSYPDTGW